MKFFLPLTLSIFLGACAITPQDKEAAHQAQLEKEARANFYALKAQINPHAATPPSPTPAPSSGFHPFAFVDTKPAPAPSQPRPPMRPMPPRDDTVYYWQVQGRAPTNPRFQAAEARYARELAKS